MTKVLKVIWPALMWLAVLAAVVVTVSTLDSSDELISLCPNGIRCE